MEKHTFQFFNEREITVEQVDDGLRICGPNGMEIFVDLYYMDSEPPHPYMHIFHSEHGEDPIAFIIWLPGQVRFETESYQEYDITQRHLTHRDLVVDLPLEEG